MNNLLEERLDRGIVKLTLNREPQLNALSAEVLKELKEAFTSYKDDSSVKAILITGAGKAFCAGADINELAQTNKDSGLKMAKNGQAVFDLIETCGKPTLAAINGFAFGGGLELAMSCTIRYAVTTAKMGQPEIKLAVIPGFGGTQRLARLVGKGRAMDLCLTGKTVDANWAYNSGLVTEVFDTTDALLDKSLDTLITLSKYSREAMSLNIQAVNEGYDLPLEQALDLEANLFAKSCATTDKNEATAAFLNKTQAEFS